MLFGNSHEQWDLFQFPELVTRLAKAKLSFVCSATLVENVDTYAVPHALAALVAATDDPIMRETLRATPSRSGAGSASCNAKPTSRCLRLSVASHPCCTAAALLSPFFSQTSCRRPDEFWAIENPFQGRFCAVAGPT